MAEVVEPLDRMIGETARTPLRLAITLEGLAYTAILLLALVLRLADLHVPPLGDAEAREALAAWHYVWPDAPGTPPLASSPLMFALNVLPLATLGSAGAAPRIMTALGGVALVLLPLLWRREMGRTAALVTSVLLLISPTALTSARTMSPGIWAMLLAVTGLWFGWRFVQARRNFDALLATVLLAGVALLADPAGLILLIILGVAWIVAVLLSGDDAPESQPMPPLRAALGDWPWRDALIAVLASVLVVGTLFLLNPRGLSQVGELLARGVEGLFRRPEGYPLSFPLLTVLLYEPPIWLFGAVGAYFALNEGRFWTRFLTGWLFAALVASVLYQGASPAHGLWLVIPLAALAGDVAARLMRPIQDAFWDVPAWAVPALTLGTVALLCVATVNLVWIARPLMSAAQPVQPQVEPLRLLLVGMTALLLVILFFLGGSLWGSRAAWHGLSLGVLLFLGVTSLSSGWGVAVLRADDARELWHVRPINRNVVLLRESLIEASFRVTGTPNRLPFLAQVPDDGALAWLFRDFADLEYVPALARGVAAPVVVTLGASELAQTGARYVGQDFLVRQAWPLSNLRLQDVPMWLLYRETLARPQDDLRAVLWVRDDIYGLPPEQPETAPTSEESAP